MMNIPGLLRAFLFRDRPVYIHYGITHRCNLRCRMCLIGRDEIREEDELSLQEIDRAARLLRRMGAVYISLGGGEPLLRRDIAAVVRIFRSRGFMVRLLTNGILAREETVRELARAGLREVSVSLDTLDPDKQAYLCAAPEMTEHPTRSIELFSRYIPSGSGPLLINTVVSPFNLEELPALSRFAKGRGWYISFIPVEAGGNPAFVFPEDSRKDIDRVYDELIRVKRAGRSAIFNSSAFLERSRTYLKYGIRGWECDAGKLYLSVDPRGMVSMCHHFEGAPLFGNGRVFSLSAEFRRISDSRRSGCPGCMRPCWAELSLFFKGGMGLREMGEVMIRRVP